MKTNDLNRTGGPAEKRRVSRRKRKKTLCSPWSTLCRIGAASLCFALCLNLTLRAQVPVQVVTKVVEKEIPYTDGQRIRVMAQKADVILKGWNRPMVSVRLRLVAKHPDRAVAEREVTYHQYTLQPTGSDIELANRFVIPQRVGKLQSQLKAMYEVSVPVKALIQLANSFGDVSLSDLSGDVSIKFEFGKLVLDDISGKLTISSEYGDVDGRGVNATLICNAQKADILLRDLGGTSRITSRYGKLTIIPNAATLDGLKVEAARTDIVLSPLRIDAFQYDLQTSFGDLRVPASHAEFLGSYGSRRTFDYQPPGKKPGISIQNSYNSISIQPGSAIGTVSR